MTDNAKDKKILCTLEPASMCPFVLIQRGRRLEQAF